MVKLLDVSKPIEQRGEFKAVEGKRVKEAFEYLDSSTTIVGGHPKHCWPRTGCCVHHAGPRANSASIQDTRAKGETLKYGYSVPCERICICERKACPRH